MFYSIDTALKLLLLISVGMSVDKFVLNFGFLLAGIFEFSLKYFLPVVKPWSRY